MKADDALSISKSVISFGVLKYSIERLSKYSSTNVTTHCHHSQNYLFILQALVGDKEFINWLFLSELELRQNKGYIEKDVFLLAVEDPKANVGSGGATINALLTVAEYMSAQRGFSVRDICLI
jgi:hypothetical protein